MKQHAQKLPEDVSLWSTVLRGWNREKKRTLWWIRLPTPNSPQIQWRQPGFCFLVSCKPLNRWDRNRTGSSGSICAKPPLLFVGFECFCCMVLGGWGGGNQAVLFLAAYFVDPLNLQPKILILHLKLITTLNTHTFTPVFVCWWSIEANFHLRYLKAMAKLSCLRLPQRVCGNCFSQKVRI